VLITFFSRFPARLFAADGGGSGAGDGGAGDAGDGQGKIKPSDVIERYGRTAEAALRMAERVADLENRNYQLRESNRTIGLERDALKGKAAPDGAVVLTTDQAKLWESYQGLGKIEDLSKAIADRDAAQRELTTFRRGAAFQQAAEAHGYKPTTLAKLPSLTGKDIETREIEVDGQKVKRAFVKDGDKELVLSEYIQQHDAEFLPALTADGGGAGGGQQRGGGTPYPQQQGNSSQRREAPNAGAAHVQKTRYALPGKEK
jgi:hypothetical protein